MTILECSDGFVVTISTEEDFEQFLKLYFTNEEEEEEENYEEPDYNEDFGFDPYMGCYSDDC